MIHIYCGDGKGKTTASIGLAVRAAGAGMNVYIFRFLKGSDSSELNSLEKIQNIHCETFIDKCNFTFNMDEQEKNMITHKHNEMLKMALNLMTSHTADMIIFDELLDAYNLDMIDHELANSMLAQQENPVEIIITGREPEDCFLNAADYVSEINSLKHPFEKGILARKGIEF